MCTKKTKPETMQESLSNAVERIDSHLNGLASNTDSADIRVSLEALRAELERHRQAMADAQSRNDDRQLVQLCIKLALMLKVFLDLDLFD